MHLFYVWPHRGMHEVFSFLVLPSAIAVIVSVTDISKRG